ncbi:MAG TPA: Bro-N domain-containing protein [Candidatus Nanoarchaeia archaeon]|nr:Bro-N domain-containing protein [Candidatus Nanoarchaeia archaeon]
MDKINSLVVFQDKKIRRIWHNDEWWFSVVDIVGILSESADARNYWKVLKHRLNEEGSESVTKCNQLKLLSSDGKYYETDCASTPTLLRLIQSIPSPKAEPFKLWLAQVGYERIQEIEDPELAQKRMKELYKLKGYSDEWVEKRVRGIHVRQELTDEWKKRGVEKNRDYGILTNEISKATFGKTVEEYKQHKQLKKENLRDHMDDLELILTMLGEATTTRFTRERDSKEFPRLKKDAKDGGDVAGSTRKDIEQKLGKSVFSNDNFLEMSEKQKRLGHKKKEK